MKVARTYTFTESEVTDWCEKSDDHNPLHLNEQAAADSDLFDERVVPGILVLDKVSGLITTWSEAKDGTPVLGGVSGVRFEEPIYFDEDVTIELWEWGSEGDEYVLQFEVRKNDEDEAVHGSMRVILP